MVLGPGGSVSAHTGAPNPCHAQHPKQYWYRFLPRPRAVPAASGSAIPHSLCCIRTGPVALALRPA